MEGVLKLQINLKKSLSTVCFTAALLILFGFLYLTVFDSPSLDLMTSFIMTLFYTISLFLGVYLIDDHHHPLRRRMLHIMWMALFLFYVIQMIYMLFFSSEFARDYVSLQNGSYKEALMQQWSFGTNLTPFETIHRMMAIFSLPNYANSIAIINLAGNLVAFMPFAFFALILFPKAQKPMYFCLSMAFLIIAVEVTQFFTLTGSMDIDDFILNYLGVLIAYGILKTRPFQRMCAILKGEAIDTPSSHHSN